MIYDNLELACKIQNEIFPKEDARENFISSINGNASKLELIYFIVYCAFEPVGITGLYSYYEYPDEAWLGWFGILEKYRHNGYGGYVLDEIVRMAKEKGYSKFRLYFGESYKSAHKLYKSRGMIQEVYENESDKLKNYSGKIFIFSRSLTGDSIDLWNNKILGISTKCDI